ncbi:MAG TPA: hypothetical protein VLJ59_17850 [Mycobacteriales bacterium]|nr:hypothetical protein [Mycobacteriales bacterium]
MATLQPAYFVRLAGALVVLPGVLLGGALLLAPGPGRRAVTLGVLLVPAGLWLAGLAMLRYVPGALRAARVVAAGVNGLAGLAGVLLVASGWWPGQAGPVLGAIGSGLLAAGAAYLLAPPSVSR